MRDPQGTIRHHISLWIGFSLLGVTIATPLATAFAQSAQERAQDLESDAKKDYPNKTYTDSMRQEGFKKAEAFNRSAKTDEEKIQYAIGNFFGFYFVNTRNHVTYCSHLGVDISPFTKAFIAANKDLYQQSSKLLYRRGVTEEQLFKQLEPELDSMTAKNFGDLAATDKLSTTQECQMQIQNLETRVARVTFSKIMPDVTQTLLDAQ